MAEGDPIVPVINPELVKDPLRAAFLPPEHVDAAISNLALNLAVLATQTSAIDRRIPEFVRLTEHVGELLQQLAQTRVEVASNMQRIVDLEAEIRNFEDRIDDLERCASLTDERVTGLMASKAWLLGIFFPCIGMISGFIALVLNYYHIEADKVFK